MKLISTLRPYELPMVNKHECSASRCKYEVNGFTLTGVCMTNCVWSVSQLDAGPTVKKYRKLLEEVHVNGET